MAADGRFFAQSPDSTLQFSGNVTNNGTVVAGLVQRNGATVFSFNAAEVPTRGVGTDTLAGTYFGASGANSAYLTIDLTGHGTLLATINGTRGGGFLNVSPDGSFVSGDGLTSGQITSTGSGYSIRIDKLNGVNENVTISAAKSSRAQWTL